MKRNEFLKIALGITGTTLLGIQVAKSINFKRNNILCGGHVWVYAKDQPGYDVSPVLNRIFSDMKYAGLDGVETMEHPLRKKETTQLISELIEQHQIPLLGTSYGADMWNRSKHNEIFEDVENIMSNLQSVKGRTFGTSVGHPSGRKKTEAEFDAQADLLKKLVALGRSKGIVLNLHNHTYEVEDNLYDLKGTLARIPDIRLGPDLNWLLRAGINPVEFLNNYRKNIVFMHLRDQLNNGKWPESIGEGDVDFKALGAALDTIDFMGDMVIELAFEDGFTPTRPIRESLKMSREYLRQQMGY